MTLDKQLTKLSFILHSLLGHTCNVIKGYSSWELERQIKSTISHKQVHDTEQQNSHEIKLNLQITGLKKQNKKQQLKGHSYAYSDTADHMTWLSSAEVYNYRHLWDFS